MSLKHPGTGEPLGFFLIAGPDHEATQRFARENIDLMQKPGYRHDPDEFEARMLLARTVGWEGITDADTGEEAPFDPAALPVLYKRAWLRRQVLLAIGNESFFYLE